MADYPQPGGFPAPGRNAFSADEERLMRHQAAASRGAPQSAPEREPDEYAKNQADDADDARKSAPFPQIKGSDPMQKATTRVIVPRESGDANIIHPDTAEEWSDDYGGRGGA